MQNTAGNSAVEPVDNLLVETGILCIVMKSSCIHTGAVLLFLYEELPDDTGGVHRILHRAFRPVRFFCNTDTGLQP